ncbi:hypothetical protein ACFFMN_31040 [Planobispora siamensis]|uniref:Lipoprotein n=1 Tax=Planobispora siamensis TaxID=936338 RepID=A0A8J3WJ80_9ACTN|nr:hypothetical protein [Planobispora siamensis]GIH91368.1 hypothetical protein Psi01_19980 [Planobispora siamensis]
MKINMMPVLTGLTSACTGTTLPACAGRVILADAPAARLRQEKSVFFQIQASRQAVSAAFPAVNGALVVPAPEIGGYGAQQTKHIPNKGGLRGPQPWRHPQVT